MATISVTTNSGVLIERFVTDEWDLSKSVAKALLIDEILAAVVIADKQNQKESHDH